MTTAKAELATFRGLRDPPPIWDGKDPAKRWVQKRRELKMWARDSDLPPSKTGVSLWRLGLPDDSPAKTLINGLTDDDKLGKRFRKHDGCVRQGLCRFPQRHGGRNV